MKIKLKKYKNLGKVTVSATGLRRMANWLQKEYKTKHNVEVAATVTAWSEDNKIKRTIGITKGD